MDEGSSDATEPSREAYIQLYKFVTDLPIAQSVANGIFRFYELTKYIRMEDSTGRADVQEGSVSFTKTEINEYPMKLPVASFNGVKFYCSSIRPDDGYLQQYFVFCSSTVKETALGAIKYAVDFKSDVFDLFQMVLDANVPLPDNTEGIKRFKHGPVEYYDVHNHPTPLADDRWREVFLKHSGFKDQREYRASIYVPDRFFSSICDKALEIEQKVFDIEGNQRNFNLRLCVRAGVDAFGWRYIELDVSDFAHNLGVPPSTILGCDTEDADL